MIKENTPAIETQRLILRRFTKNDVAAYFKIMSDEKTNKYLPWFPVKTLEEAGLSLHERFLDLYGLPSGYRYAICLKEDDVPIGYCVLSSGDGNDFGYGLESSFWNKGIATEAASAILRRIKQSGCPYVTATHDVTNGGSGRVMKKLGMSYRYSYVENWQPKNLQVTFRMYQLDFDGGNGQTYMGYWNRYENHFIERDI